MKTDTLLITERMLSFEVLLDANPAKIDIEPNHLLIEKEIDENALKF